MLRFDAVGFDIEQLEVLQHEAVPNAVFTPERPRSTGGPAPEPSRGRGSL